MLSANPAARSALIYITIGALMDVWGGIWLWYIRSIPPGTRDPSWNYVCTGVLLTGIVLMAIGFLVAYQFYIRRPDIPVELARQQEPLYRFLLNKWYFDELYDLIFVRPALWLGRVLWKGGDGFIIDGLGPDGVSARVLDVTRNVIRLQTGYLYHYAFAMLIGIAAFITWFMFYGGGH